MNFNPFKSEKIESLNISDKNELKSLYCMSLEILLLEQLKLNQELIKIINELKEKEVKEENQVPYFYFNTN